MAKKKILIIDDEEHYTRLIKLNLERTGKFEVETENRGLYGLATAGKFKPDLILLDIIMPDLDGGDVGSQLKNNAATRDIPIIFLTAIVSKEETTSQDGMIGSQPFIAKTVSVEELVKRIEENIR